MTCGNAETVTAEGRATGAWLLGLIVMAGLGVYTEPGAAEEDPWWDMDVEAVTRAVNEGELQFLMEPPAKPVHHHANRVTIREDSLDDGWVTLEQCHDNLDAVPRLEVVFRRATTRDIRVVTAKDIGHAAVEGASVQLEDVGRHARLCVSAQSRALDRGGDGVYVLRNGPFLRRFLDGYYPMRVEMEVAYPCGLLDLVASSPAVQPGFTVAQSDCGVTYDTWFEGRLRTELVFKRNGAPAS